MAYASWRAPAPLHLPEVTPLRARPLTDAGGTRYAVAPFGRAGLVLVCARSDEDDLPTAAFHITEVDRIAQLVRAAAVISATASTTPPSPRSPSTAPSPSARAAIAARLFVPPGRAAPLSRTARPVGVSGFLGLSAQLDPAC